MVNRSYNSGQTSLRTITCFEPSMFELTRFYCNVLRMWLLPLVPSMVRRQCLCLTLSQTCLQYKFFENTVGKGEIARNEQLHLFPQCFSALSEDFVSFSLNSKLPSANSFSLEESKIVRLGNTSKQRND